MTKAHRSAYAPYPTIRKDTAMNAPSDQITVTEDNHLVALCPHCETPLTTISTRMLGTIGTLTSRFGKRYIYACPTCNKALGVSHRKGFWMG